MKHFTTLNIDNNLLMFEPYSFGKKENIKSSETTIIGGKIL